MADHPGYVDLQVNGYADVDFNADRLNAEQVAAVCLRLRNDGVAGILATVITADIEAMCRRMANIVRVHDEDPTIREMIWGIHMEGPFLNEQRGYIGAHPAEFARPAELDTAKQLMDAAGGLLQVVTLAPERDEGARVTRMLADMSVRVSAGHCNPTLDELRAGIDAGLTMFTHLGNGCPALLPRHDNIIQRVLSISEQLHISFIADGVHVPFVALGNYLKCCGIDRALIVTDAICGAGLGPGEYSLGDRRVVVDENLATWAADRSHLVGSAGTMQRSAENLRTVLGLDHQHIKQLLVDNPRRILVGESGR
jgi:N-acetylglucosamine-6-phosphate deacetylase